LWFVFHIGLQVWHMPALGGALPPPLSCRVGEAFMFVFLRIRQQDKAAVMAGGLFKLLDDGVLIDTAPRFG
jgi:hypothetical protein